MNDSSAAETSLETPLSGSLNFKLSTMMFLQYAIWGAWLPLLFPFLMFYRGMAGWEIGMMFSIGAVGAILAPFIAGQIADRFFSTEKYLALSHIVGGLLVWQLAWVASFTEFLIFSLIYSIVYSPTLALTNSLAFHHLPNRDRDFGKVRVWGTIGWICVGIAIGQWLLYSYTPTPQEAINRVIKENFSSKENRNKLLTQNQITYKQANGYTTIKVGIVSEDPSNKGQMIITTGSGEGKQETKVSKEAITQNIPYYSSLAAAAPGDAKKGDSPKAEAIKAALTKLNTKEDPGVIKQIETEFLEKNILSGTVLNDTIFKKFQVPGMKDAFKLSAILGILMGIYCFFLPHTPPQKGAEANATGEALKEIQRNPLLLLFLLSIPISCIHQFYFVHTAGFLGKQQVGSSSGISDLVQTIFGVGGGGLMTIGQMTEILVLALIPLVAAKLSRKSLLAIGILAYALRMCLFAYFKEIATYTSVDPMIILISGVALHGFCFGCFIFVAFMIVDEETTPDVRASAQSLYNLVVVGIGIIVGSLIATDLVPRMAKAADGSTDYQQLFAVPMWGSVVCLVILLIFYPSPKTALPETK